MPSSCAGHWCKMNANGSVCILFHLQQHLPQLIISHNLIVLCFWHYALWFPPTPLAYFWSVIVAIPLFLNGIPEWWNLLGLLGHLFSLLDNLSVYLALNNINVLMSHLYPFMFLFLFLERESESKQLLVKITLENSLGSHLLRRTTYHLYFLPKTDRDCCSLIAK